MLKRAVRKPAVAGQFYPSQPDRLRSMVEEFVDGSGVEPAPDKVAALVVPHAGYVYSGQTAGYAYARVRGKSPKRVIVAGCSHREYISTASVWTSGAFQTPLGSFPIDEAFAQALAEETGSDSTNPHSLEHALEVQLPFLAAVFGEVPIVPVLFGASSTEWHAGIGRALAKLTEDDDLLVASTDLSHYLCEEEANIIDKRTIEAVLAGDWQQFSRGIAAGDYSMCGATAVATAMTYAQARDATSWQLLDYRTSAGASRDYDRVVGYAAISMECEG